MFHQTTGGCPRVFFYSEFQGRNPKTAGRNRGTAATAPKNDPRMAVILRQTSNPTAQFGPETQKSGCENRELRAGARPAGGSRHGLQPEEVLNPDGDTETTAPLGETSPHRT